jgi:hypothetical protein
MIQHSYSPMIQHSYSPLVTHQVSFLFSVNVNKLNITYLNVCGISSKLLNPDFETLINNYDILILVETKTDEWMCDKFIF